ncbi:MAG TPA: contact-dependent growth inhibition system immunity protein [Chitinophagaceae bacterium]|nr:contact-dependent growth inhibition system immunity protein [Chitinophagaceae bacterium]
MIMKVDLHKSLEQLENKVWGEPEYTSHLVTTLYRLRKKPLKEYTIEDLRISIGQNSSLDYLMPLAIEVLNKDILAEGDFYKGDLLHSVLTADIAYWKQHISEWSAVKALFEENRELFDSDSYRKLRRSFEEFEKINEP